MVLQSGKKKSDFRINISRKEKKIMKMKRMAAAMLAAMMTAYPSRHVARVETTQKTRQGAKSRRQRNGKKTTERPEAVSEEDWEAMRKEPAFGTELNYLFNGGACVSAKYLAEDWDIMKSTVSTQHMFRAGLLWDRWNRAMYVGDRPHCDYARAGYKRCQNDIRMRRAYWV